MIKKCEACPKEIEIKDGVGYQYTLVGDGDDYIFYLCEECSREMESGRMKVVLTKRGGNGQIS